MNQDYLWMSVVRGVVRDPPVHYESGVVVFLPCQEACCKRPGEGEWELLCMSEEEAG